MNRLGISHINHRHIQIHVDKALEQGIVNHQQSEWGFKFEKVLSNASQELVYNLSSS